MLFALSSLARAADLLVDGTVVYAVGSVAYDRVEVVNGGTLRLTWTFGGPSELRLTATDHVLVDATSRIELGGVGWSGHTLAGEGPGGGARGGSPLGSGGAGGGSHGGSGGRGATAACALTGGAGGAPYDEVPDPATLGAGSGGGGEDRNSLGVAGGDGAGLLVVDAPVIEIHGLVAADGGGGTSWGGPAADVVPGLASGGGGGGGVALLAGELVCDGLVSARGGAAGAVAGDDQGGGGGGGVVLQRWDTRGIVCAVRVEGGPNAVCPASSGGAGVAVHEAFDRDGDGVTAAATCVGTPEVGDGLDSDCDGIADDTVDDDADGLDVPTELALGTDPEVADTDGDHLRDGDEVALGTDPTDPDTDGGGRLDGEERFGQDPFDPADDALALGRPLPGRVGANAWVVTGAPAGATVTVVATRHWTEVGAFADPCAVDGPRRTVVGSAVADGGGVARVVGALPGSGRWYSQALIEGACLRTPISVRRVP